MSIDFLSVARKGLPNLIGKSKSTSQSRSQNWKNNKKEDTFTNSSYKIPTNFFIMRSAIKNLIKVGLGDPNPNYL